MSRGLGDVYKRQIHTGIVEEHPGHGVDTEDQLEIVEQLLEKRAQ